MLPLMEGHVVQKKQWLSPKEFTQGVAIAELVPGPIAVKVCSYVGYRLRGWRGALISIVCFSLPSFFVITLLGLYLFGSNNTSPYTLPLSTLPPVVVGLFLVTAWRIGQPCLIRPIHWAIAVVTFVALKLGGSPLIVLWGTGLLSVGWAALNKK